MRSLRTKLLRLTQLRPPENRIPSSPEDFANQPSATILRAVFLLFYPPRDQRRIEAAGTAQPEAKADMRAPLAWLRGISPGAEAGRQPSGRDSDMVGMAAPWSCHVKSLCSKSNPIIRIRSAEIPISPSKKQQLYPSPR